MSFNDYGTKQEVSSIFTFTLKFILTPVWILGFGVCSIWMVFYSTDEWILLIIWIITSALIYILFGRIKKVEVDYNFLYISDYRHAIQIPLTAVQDISNSKWIRFNTIWIKFKHPTRFGEEIVFIPDDISDRYTGEPPPLVDELRMLAGIKKH
jgi:hypothetical protein